MIQITKGKLVEQMLVGKPGKVFPNDIFRVAVQKIAMLEAAVNLDDLRSPPGKRLEALSDDREGQHSIRTTTNGVSVLSGPTVARTT